MIPAEPASIHQLKTKSNKDTYHTLCNLLENQKKVYFSRFGDADIFILMGRKPTNHELNDQLKEEIYMSLTIEHPQYLRGLIVTFPHEKGVIKGLFERYYHNDELAEFIIGNVSLSWPSVFENSWFPNYYTSFYPKEMNRFLDRFIRPKKKMFIGSVGQSDVQKLVGDIDCYIPVPRKNAYASIGEWWPKILKHIDSVEVVLPAAGQATRVITKRLWELNKEVHCIDLGSIVDAVSSFPPSRKWIRLKGHMVNRIILPEYRDNSLSYWVKYGIKEAFLFFRYHYYKIDPLSNLPIFPQAKNWKPGPKRFNA
jgi:hypothetical protein